jgi:hypothetical protein
LSTVFLILIKDFETADEIVLRLSARCFFAEEVKKRRQYCVYYRAFLAKAAEKQLPRIVTKI